MNKGLADKLARRPAGPPKSQVRRLGILGAGMMGAGVAYVSARAGMDVVLLDSTPELAEKGKDYSRQLLAKDVSRGKRTQADADAVLARIKTTSSYDDLAGADLVIEAVFESREIKADVTAKAEAVIPKNAVFASNTSTLPITGLAQASKRPAQFIGIHFFSPVDKMPLVEIILGKKTSDDTLARALDYVGQLRKTPIVVNDSRGFYTSRCFGTFVYEGMAMLQEGVNPALIENAAKLAGMPVGPLAVADEVTIDLQWKVIKQTEADLGRRFDKPVAYDVVKTFVEELKRPGRRFGAGFYDYPQDAQEAPVGGARGRVPAGRGAALGRRRREAPAVHPGARGGALHGGGRGHHRGGGGPGLDPRLGLPGVDGRHAVLHRHHRHPRVRGRVRPARQAPRQALQAVEVAATAGGARRGVPSGGGWRVAGRVSWLPPLASPRFRVHARGRREPIPGGSGRGIHAAHGPAHPPGTRRRRRAAAHRASRVRPCPLPRSSSCRFRPRFATA